MTTHEVYQHFVKGPFERIRTHVTHGYVSHAMAARGFILTASTWTAVLQLFMENSMAHRAAGDSVVIDLVNVVVLLLAAVGWADLVWHDILGKLIMPRINPHVRHVFCVRLYLFLSVAFGLRACVAAGDPTAAVTVGSYYILASVFVFLEAVAISNERRKDVPP